MYRGLWHGLNKVTGIIDYLLPHTADWHCAATNALRRGDPEERSHSRVTHLISDAIWLEAWGRSTGRRHREGQVRKRRRQSWLKWRAATVFTSKREDLPAAAENLRGSLQLAAHARMKAEWAKRQTGG